MSKYILSLALALCSLTGLHASHVNAPISEPQLWQVLYQGNWSLSHKMVLTRPINSTNDQIMSSFMLAYAKYRSGDEQEALNILKSVDNYIESVYLPNSGD